jgi:hypothetical protein
VKKNRDFVKWWETKEINVIVSVFRLLHWIQSKVPDLPITNFTSDWNDGKAVGALVDAVAPGTRWFSLCIFCFISFFGL